MENLTRRDQVRKKFLEILESYPQGKRFAELVEEIQKYFPTFPLGTITGSVWNLDTVMPDVVSKYSRGVWVLKKNMIEQLEPDIDIIESEKFRIKEEDFYEAVKNYLIVELQECTESITLGGNLFKDKWGTPDVIGVNKPKPTDILKFPVEIVSVEVKTDTSSLITAFGQACSYKLFSHKTYIAIPENSPTEDIERLESLSLIIGIGLITFDNKNPNDPKFKIKCRAIKTDPDMFYVNKNIRYVADSLL
jgi:hypothetical protein